MRVALYRNLTVVPYSAPKAGMIISGRRKWVSRVAHIGEMEGAHRILVMKHGYLGIGGSIILIKIIKDEGV